MHAGVEDTGGSEPHTWYDPGPSPVGGAIDCVELVQIVPLVDGTGLVTQFATLPNDQETGLWYPEHEPLGVKEYVATSLAPA